MAKAALQYRVDPNDPRAPSEAVWERLSAEERQRILEDLPSEIALAEPPEGDLHSVPKFGLRHELELYYRRIGRRVYFASELPVYYPGERMFAPDMMVVFDVELRTRDHWTVSHERRGLDFALEIHVRGSAVKDFEENVVRYARVGIPEYFAFAPRQFRLEGWRLANGKAGTYEPIIPRGGRWHSQILGLDLTLEGSRLRFYHGSAVLLDGPELSERLHAMADAATRRAEEEGRRAEEEARRAEEEARRAEEEARRAEEEARRAERLAARLRELGVDPDAI
jgi:Uma2 family endonuclease